MDRELHQKKITELNELSFKNIDISKIRTTGIGLKISKQIVDLHQGSISFASVQNEFFEVSFHFRFSTLPIR